MYFLFSQNIFSIFSGWTFHFRFVLTLDVYRVRSIRCFLQLCLLFFYLQKRLQQKPECKVQSAKCKVQSAKCKVQSVKCKVQSVKCRVTWARFYYTTCFLFSQNIFSIFSGQTFHFRFVLTLSCLAYVPQGPSGLLLIMTSFDYYFLLLQSKRKTLEKTVVISINPRSFLKRKVQSAKRKVQSVKCKVQK